MSLLNDACVVYNKDFLGKQDADLLFHQLKGLDWRLRNYRKTKLNRETTVYADKDLTLKAPAIWGEDAVVNVWTEELYNLKSMVERETGETYNICLGNKYIGNHQFIGLHCDNEEYGDTKSIASISLGTTRSFRFVRKRNEAGRIENLEKELTHGSLLVMGEHCQENYLHGMKKEENRKDDEYDNTRINITFRKFILNK
jgi:alkylated DNA repair dioxygenase AlkB